jgi:hypothetical protein
MRSCCFSFLFFFIFAAVWVGLGWLDRSKETDTSVLSRLFFTTPVLRSAGPIALLAKWFDQCNLTVQVGEYSGYPGIWRLVTGPFAMHVILTVCVEEGFSDYGACRALSRCMVR